MRSCWIIPSTNQLSSVVKPFNHGKNRWSLAIKSQIPIKMSETKNPTIWGFPKMVAPNNHGFFYTKNDHFGVFWGYHYLRKHPYRFQWRFHHRSVCQLFFGGVAPLVSMHFCTTCRFDSYAVHVVDGQHPATSWDVSNCIKL